jgi:hypothetical protein
MRAVVWHGPRDGRVQRVRGGVVIPWNGNGPLRMQQARPAASTVVLPLAPR